MKRLNGSFLAAAVALLLALPSLALAQNVGALTKIFNSAGPPRNIKPVVPKKITPLKTTKAPANAVEASVKKIETPPPSAVERAANTRSFSQRDLNNLPKRPSRAGARADVSGNTRKPGGGIDVKKPTNSKIFDVSKKKDQVMKHKTKHYRFFQLENHGDNVYRKNVWFTRDRGHGVSRATSAHVTSRESVWKKYEYRKDPPGLHWQANLDKDGVKINQHKGPVLRFIPEKDLLF